jgi:hypothetical protein
MSTGSRAALIKRLERLEATVKPPDPRDPRDWPIYSVHMWAAHAGCPRTFQQGEEDELLAKYAPIAKDALVSAGELRPEDRECVQLLVEVIVPSPYRNEPRPELEQLPDRAVPKHANGSGQTPPGGP